MFVKCVLLACTALLLAVEVRAQLTIEVDPPNATVTEGSNFTITCSTGSGSILPDLLNNTDPVDVDSNDRVDSESLPSPSGTIAFTVLSVTPADNGSVFQCDSIGNDPTDPETLIVLYRPILDGLADEVGVLEGTDTTLVTLSADANPAVTMDDVTLTKDTGNVPESTISIDGQMITISLSNVMRGDAGRYTVEVANSQGMNNDNFILNVYYGPTFTDMNRTVTAAVGDSVMLDCSIAESNPDANVTLTTTPSTITGVEFTDYIITIASATMGNAGIYTCTADSGEAQATLLFTLNVGNPPSGIEVTVTARYNEDNVLTVTLETNSTDATITYEVVLIYRDGMVSLGNYTLAELTNDIESDDTTFNPMLSYTVEVIARNMYGSTTVGEGEARFATDPTTMPTTEGAGVTTIATTALVLMMVIISLML